MSKDEIKKKTLDFGESSIVSKIKRHKYLLVVSLGATAVFVMGVFGLLALQKVWKASESFATIDVPAFSKLYKLEEILTREEVSVNRLLEAFNTDQKTTNLTIALIKQNNIEIGQYLSDLEVLIKETDERNSLKKIENRFYLLEEKVNELTKIIERNNFSDSEQSLSNIKSIILQMQEESFNFSHLIDNRVANNSNTLKDTNSFTRFNLILLSICGLFIASLMALLAGKKNLLNAMPSTEKNVEELAKLNKDLNVSNELLTQRDRTLSEVNDKLRQQDSARSEFVSIVAHQLRTPLAGIKWTLDMLVNGDIGKLNDEQNMMLFKVMESNDRMIRFVNDLLSLSRIETGRLEYNFVPVNLQHIAESVLLDLYPLANKKQIIINFRGKGLTLPTVLADTEKIRAVFQNLLENAIKYSSQGGHVIIELRNKGSEILTSVIDEGLGIPLDEQKNIFNRFYRAPSAAKTESEGSGLGLYLARNIVEGHGGKIWFESEVGKGTSFYFTIPVSKTPLI